MAAPRYPALYQINTRVWLAEVSRTLGRRATVDDIPDAELDQLAGQGFDWVWLLSVWQTGAAAQAISRGNPEWRREFEETLPDLDEEDIPGSGFAIAAYTVHRRLGGKAALARLRERPWARTSDPRDDPAARLRQPGHAGGHDRRAAEEGRRRAGPAAGARNLYRGSAARTRTRPGAGR